MTLVLDVSTFALPFVRSGGGGGDVVGPPVPPVIARDFAGSASSTTGLIVVRAGTWYAADSAGVYQSFAANTARRTDLGLLGESARTNGIANSSMAGGAIGSPGTAFTNWVISGSVSGLVRTINQKATDDGLPTADTQWVGTYGGITLVITPMGKTEMAAVAGDTVTSTFWIEAVSGLADAQSMSFANAISECAGGVEISGGRHTLEMDLVAGTVGINKFSYTTTFTKGTAAFACSFLEFGGTGATLGAKDFRVRYACQLEKGECSTSPIPTSTGAVTRPEDVITEAFTSTVNGTIQLTATAPDGALDATILSISNGTVDNRIDIYRDSVGFVHALVVRAGATAADIIGGSVSNSETFDLYFAWESGSYSVKLNDESIRHVTGAFPAGLNSLRYCGGPLGNWNSTIQSIAVYDYKVAIADDVIVLPYLSAASFGMFPAGYIVATAGKELRQEINWYVNGDEPMSELIWTACGWYAETDNIEHDLGNDQTVQGYWHIPAFGALVPMTFGGSTTGTIPDGVVEYRSDPLMPVAIGQTAFPAGMVWSARTARLVPTGGKHPATTVFGFFDDDAVEGPPGSVLQINGTGPLVATGGSTLTFNYQRAPVILGLGVP